MKAASIDQAKPASNDKAKAASNDQAKAASNGKDQDGIVALVTRDQKKERLKMWKELLMQTKDYRPFQQPCMHVRFSGARGGVLATLL